MIRNMISPRDFSYIGLTGHAVQFKANEPTPVPFELQSELLHLNVIFEDGNFAQTPVDKDGKPAKVEMSGAIREAVLFHVIGQIHADAQTEEFDGGGAPKAAAIAARCGITVNSTERGKLWDRYRNAKATNGILPAHPMVEAFVDIQKVNSMKAANEFAEAYDVPAELLVGTTKVNEAKRIILAHLVNAKPTAG